MVIRQGADFNKLITERNNSSTNTVEKATMRLTNNVGTVRTVGARTSCSKDLNDYNTAYIYTGCPRRNVKYFGKVFLILNYTDITQNTYIQS